MHLLKDKNDGKRLAKIYDRHRHLGIEAFRQPPEPYNDRLIGNTKDSTGNPFLSWPERRRKAREMAWKFFLNLSECCL
jgi:hypothetical protein